MRDLLALYLHLWTIALHRTASADGWIAVAALLVFPAAVVFVVHLIVWQLVNALTFGALAQQDVRRKEARWARRGR